MVGHQTENNKDKHLEVTVRNLMPCPFEVLSDFIMNAIVNEENHTLQVDKLKRELHNLVKESNDLICENMSYQGLGIQYQSFGNKE